MLGIFVIIGIVAGATALGGPTAGGVALVVLALAVVVAYEG